MPNAAALALLSRLAHRGAYAVRTEDASRGREIAVFSPRNNFAAPVAAAPESSFALARAKGWIEPDAVPERWRLASKGVATLKIARSMPRPTRSAASARAAASPRTPLQNDGESPLAWLRRRRDKDGNPLITGAQFDAGERLRSDFWHAQMTPRVTSGWSGNPRSRERRSAPGAGIEMPDRIVAARQRVHAALRAAGSEFAGLLIDVCGHLRGLEELEREAGWPQRSAKIFLRFALTRLARHYGLIPDEAEAEQIGRRLRHWGDAGYRPTADAWK